jgi:AcrR family transcriptional regulator
MDVPFVVRSARGRQAPMMTVTTSRSFHGLHFLFGGRDTLVPAVPKPPRRPYHHGDLRRAVLDEALALVEERGHVGFTLREVTRRIGVSHAAPYRHFADRRALLTALASEALEALAKRIEAALAEAGEAPRARFLAGGRAYVRFAVDCPAAFRTMFSAEVDAGDPTLLAAKERSFGLLLAFLGEAQRAGVFPPGDPTALAKPIWAMHHGLASLAVAGAFADEGPGGLDRIVDDAHARLFEGLRRG